MTVKRFWECAIFGGVLEGLFQTANLECDRLAAFVVRGSDKRMFGYGY